MIHRWYQLTFIRMCMVIFWVVILLIFLQSTKFISFLYPQKSITIFTWPRILDANYLKRFVQETGIKLHISYYESNEELISKLKATGGRGYDIVIPTDYAVSWLVEHHLLKKLDKKKLTFFNQLRPSLLGRYYDPNNNYSIPYFWSVYGIGINKTFFKDKKPPATWALLFDKTLIPDKIGMTNYPREAILITAQYLFGSINALKDKTQRGKTNKKNLNKVKQTLIEQKKNVVLYTDEMAELLLLSQGAPVAVGQSADILRIAKDNPHIDFIVPKEGSFLNIESIAITKASQNEDLVYKFINYLYQPDTLTYHTNEFSFCSPIQNTNSNTDLSDKNTFCFDDNTLKKFILFKDVISNQELNDLWIELMAN